MIIIPTLRQIARALRCGEHHAETVLHDKAAGERSLALSRRGLLRAGGAIAAGALISVPSLAAITFPRGGTYKNVTWYANGQKLSVGLAYFVETPRKMPSLAGFRPGISSVEIKIFPGESPAGATHGEIQL